MTGRSLTKFITPPRYRSPCTVIFRRDRLIRRLNNGLPFGQMVPINPKAGMGSIINRKNDAMLAATPFSHSSCGKEESVQIQAADKNIVIPR